MLHNKKIVVVLPAYKAEKTLEATYLEIPRDIVDEVVLVDDASSDDTVAVAGRRSTGSRGWGLEASVYFQSDRGRHWRGHNGTGTH